MPAYDDGPLDEVLTTSLAALDAGWATTDQLRAASAWRRKTRPQLGKLALMRRKLTVAQVFDVLGQQAVDGGLFGEVALKLQFLTRSDLYELLDLQAELTPTMADALVALGLVSPEQATSVWRRSCPTSARRRGGPALVSPGEWTNCQAPSSLAVD